MILFQSSNLVAILISVLFRSLFAFIGIKRDAYQYLSSETSLYCIDIST